ncbi:MAG: tRNA pseudouridine(38-40) synthase TruA [Firmicutes bacterium]|jgi:tRNA pseudouridine38-40 synthase|nr:tRNA pseudouridine(38-40) synthase TruA [Bacillota bacterium]
MENILLRVSYDGTEYGGFQLQRNAVTIQEKLEEALLQIYGVPIRIKCAGRTDAGVHARGQAVNYEAEPLVPVDRIPWALNTKLPREIVVWKAEVVGEGFHAGHDAVSKVYSYTIDTAEFIQVMERRYAWHCPAKLDLQRMEEGCRIIEGRHDFRLFQAAGGKVKDTRRIIYHARTREDRERQIIRILLEGDGFLYKMVRFLAGALVEMGKGDLGAAVLGEALENPSLHSRLGPALPARGVCLEKVNYGNKK